MNVKIFKYSFHPLDYFKKKLSFGANMLLTTVILFLPGMQT